MQIRNRNIFTTIHTEGALLPADLLQRISENDAKLDGLGAESYHLAPGEKLNEAINHSWNRLNGLWSAFQAARARLGPGDAGTTLTRERWLLPLFQELGFGRLSIAKVVEIEGKTYPISHRRENVPLHLVGCGLELDKRAPGVAGASRTSPHSLLQEYLNRSADALWGLISNGLSLRILRDNATLTRQAYIEFDLESLFDGEVYSDFVLLWLVCHQSRFETTDKQTEKQADSILESWSKSAQERGTRALEDLRRGVEEAIVSLGQGFLQHPLNGDLRARLKSGDLPAQDYYRQLLRLVYRLIFLFAAEDRDLLLLPEASIEARQRYLDFYSTSRLRSLAEKQRGSRHHDRYEGLRQVMTLLGSEQGCPELAIPALGGFLFDASSTVDLNQTRLDNQSLLAAVRSLAFITEGNIRRTVDYRNLGSEELGSVYESLLELHPLLNTDAGTFQLSSAAGNERKTTGSYYTPTSLIQVLLDSALNPVIEQALNHADTQVTKKEEMDSFVSPGGLRGSKEKALLDLKICDPACGSGHFLIAAAHRLAGRLAQVRTAGDEPSPQETRRALRDVIRHCIYGVDLNPMSVELCKVNLWLESLEPGRPLSFLDAHIQCGDSLVGVAPGLDISEIPDEAFNPAFGDDKATASALKKRNKAERGGQMGLDVFVIRDQGDLAAWMARQAQELDALPEETAGQVGQKAQTYREYLDSPQYRRRKQEYDLWTAAFFWKMEAQPGSAGILAPTHEMLRRQRSGGTLPPELLGRVDELARRLNFLHWELVFPKIFAGDNPGFDCVLGNPPWETLQSSEQEFFATRNPEIAILPGDLRKKAIAELVRTDIVIARAFEEANHLSNAQNKFIKYGNRYPLTAIGKLNTYALFAEHFQHLVSQNGNAGIVVPSGIATDDSTKHFFGDLVRKRAVTSIFDFENREGLFSAVDSRYRFCLFTVSKTPVKQSEFVFFATNVNHLKDDRRRFVLDSQEISLLNPNTHTMPVFRTSTDAEITRSIYKKFPILDNEHTEENPWGIWFKQGLFNMTTDSKLFKINSQHNHMPLYEAKLIWHFDHHWATFDGDDTRELTNTERNNPYFKIRPRYWVPESEVMAQLGDWRWNWFLGFRDVTNATNERTAIFSIIPKVGVGHNLPLMFVRAIEKIPCFLGNMNSLIFDYIARQKVGGVHLTFMYLKQLPILPPNLYTPVDIAYIAPRVLELVYTAYDLKPFAEDMGYFSEPFKWDEERRALLRAELDAYYARLYGLTRDELRYILDPKEVYGEDFPGETFRVLKDKEIRLYGEYRTRRLVLEAWDKLEGVEVTGYQAPGDSGLSTATGGLSTATSGLSLPTSAQPSVTGGLSAATGGLSAATGGLSTRAREVKPVEDNPAQPMLSDFGLYKCAECGKMVMGYEKEKHAAEVHQGAVVEFIRIK
jgi:hypothetical protein